MKRNLPERTARGTKRKSEDEIAEAVQDGLDRMDGDEALLWSQHIREGKRGYGDRLSEGFGMLGEY